MSFFSEDDLKGWRKLWKGMPSYSNVDMDPRYQLIVNFMCAEDVYDFAELIGQPLKVSGATKKLVSIWHPPHGAPAENSLRWVTVEPPRRADGSDIIEETSDGEIDQT